MDTQEQMDELKELLPYLDSPLVMGREIKKLRMALERMIENAGTLTNLGMERIARKALKP